MKRFWILALAAASLAACQQKEEPVTAAPGSVTVEPIITKATEVNFENGDLIGLTMKKVNDAEDYATNAKLTFAGDVFSGDLKWYADAYSEADVYAYYPYEAEGVPTTFAVETDQTAGIGASDFMAASKKGVLPTLGAITMVFQHQMTKIAVSVDNQTGSPVSEVLIQNTVPVATVDVANLAVAPSDGAEAADIKAFEVTDDKAYTAIVVPQTVAMKVSVVFENKKVMTQPLASMTLKPGGQYSVEIRVLADDMTVSATGEILNWTDEGKIAFEGESSVGDKPVTFTEYDGYFEYDGVEYKTVKLDDGNTWMAENLRFIPRGRTVSSDPTVDAGIWYPAANADKVADPALVETLGLLYDAATAFGVSEITAANAATFEGCQGICPKGWHIPTVKDMTGLVGHSADASQVNPEAPYYDSTIKGASIAALAEDGWPWTFASCRNKTNTAATGSYLVTAYGDVYGVMSYVIGSSLAKDPTLNDDGSLKNVQYHYFMPLYNASSEKVYVAFGNFLSGASIRCVKDKE